MIISQYFSSVTRAHLWDSLGISAFGLQGTWYAQNEECRKGWEERDEGGEKRTRHFVTKVKVRALRGVCLPEIIAVRLKIVFKKYMNYLECDMNSITMP